MQLLRRGMVIIAGIISTVVVAGVFIIVGVKLEKDSCLVRAYENRIDVDLGKKVCSFNSSNNDHYVEPPPLVVEKKVVIEPVPEVTKVVATKPTPKLGK